MNVKQILSFTFMLLTVGAVHAQDYELVWSDEFDTNTLGTNWNVEVTDAPYNAAGRLPPVVSTASTRSPSPTVR